MKIGNRGRIAVQFMLYVVATLIMTVLPMEVHAVIFDAPGMYDAGTNPYSVTLGDFNGDRNLDLAVANNGSDSVSIFLGNGNGTFQATVSYSAGAYPNSVTAGDFNGDGNLDLVVTNTTGSSISILLGNGNGTFQTAVSYGVGASPRSVTLGDFNGDGNLDLTVANYGSNNVSILLGNGNGTFQTAMSYGAGTNPISVSSGDVNGDGNLDLAVANYGSNNVSVLLGNGNGTFQAAVNYGVGTNPYSVATGDVNGDGNIDLAVANSFSNNVSVLLGNGHGTFQTAGSYGAGTAPSSVTTGDFNGDGNLDLAVANSGISILLGNGNGSFQTAVNYGVGTYPYSVTTGDFNGDGNIDLAVANHSSNNVSILLGDGNGTFQAAVNYGVGTNPSSVTTGDFNGDGNIDLAVANTSSGNISILFGNGNGTFQTGVYYYGGAYPSFVTSGDFNGDGNLDLAVANLAVGNNTRSVSILLGNGNGTFQTAVIYGAGVRPTSIATGDFNGDGNLDLAVANPGSWNISILLGNGNGTFQAAVNYGMGTSTGFVTSGDFNGDGNLDLAIANSDNVSILLGNGNGTFARAGNYGSGTSPRSLALGDFNGDGTLDLAVTNSDYVSILLNTMLRIMPNVVSHGSISCNPLMVDPGQSSSCTISADSGYMITDVVVNGSSVGAVSTYNFTNITADQTISATFAPSQYQLSVSVTGSGIVTSSPAGINCGSACLASFPSSTSVTLTASPGTGYAFIGWSGACTGTSACQVTMSQARSVTATFAPICRVPYQITAPTSADSGNYAVSWYASATTGAAYVLEEKVGSGAWTEVYTGTAKTNTFSSKANGTYRYRVKATLAGYADSNWTTSGVVTVNLTCSASYQVTAPANVATGNYTISWYASATPGVTYVLEEKVNSGAWTQVFTGTAKAYAFSSKPNGTYQYRVKATLAGITDSTWTTSGVVNATYTCSAPYQVTAPATSASGNYAITWYASATTGGLYVLEEKVNSGLWTSVTSVTATSRSISGKTNGTYQYRVKVTKGGYVDSNWTKSGVVTVP